jgi:hypothetical protein
MKEPKRIVVLIEHSNYRDGLDPMGAGLGGERLEEP